MHDNHKNLVGLGIILNAGFTVIELIVGLMSNSLALISDAAHDFTDVIALIMSYFAIKLTERPANDKMTWGYYRATILAAFLNGIFLVIVSLAIIRSAYLRLLNPQPIDGLLVLIVAVIGVIVNGAVVLRMRSAKDHDVNMRSIYWHLTEDALGWLGVLVAGVVIYFTGWFMIDTLVSIMLGLFVMYGAYGILRETTDILLEATPKGIELEAVKKEILKIKPVRDVHDLHIWTVGSQLYALSAHASLPDMKLCDTEAVLKKIEAVLHDKFSIHHATIAFEADFCVSKNHAKLTK